LPVVTDIRAYGLIAGIDLAPTGTPGVRGYRCRRPCSTAALHIKTTGDAAIIVAPALVAERHHIDEIVSILRRALAEER
jgi:beta-alanine--pyruvate transaminase